MKLLFMAAAVVLIVALYPQFRANLPVLLGDLGHIRIEWQQ